MITTKSALLWRNFLLAMAVLFGTFAWCDGFRPVGRLTSSRSIIALAAVVIASGLAASAIREFAGIVFRMDEKPWYGQFSAVIFLAVVLTVGVSAFCLVNDVYGAPYTSWTEFQEQCAFLGIACTLVWIVLLDWPAPQASPPQLPVKRYTTPLHTTWPSSTTTSKPNVQPRTTPKKRTEGHPLLDDRTNR